MPWCPWGATVRSCGRYSRQYACQAPLMGINLGRVGFLTETEPERLEEAAQALVAGRYTLEERACCMPSGNARARAIWH